jgi:hypothetical protein
VSVTLEFYDENGQIVNRVGVVNTTVPVDIPLPPDAVRVEVRLSPASAPVPPISFVEVQS